MIEHRSPFGFDATLDRLIGAIERAGLTIFARIDHAAGARDAGPAMLPTVGEGDRAMKVVAII